MHTRQIKALVIANLFLLVLILPQLALDAGPEMANAYVWDITSTTATIFWTPITNDIQLNYCTTTALGQVNYDSTEVTTHFTYLTGLIPDTTYYFEVKSTDISGATTADTEYSITLDPTSGVCGELIGIGVCSEVIDTTVTVAAAGTYHICWNSRSAATTVETFTATGAGSYTLTFYMPEAKKGIHTIYLVDTAYSEKARAGFEVFPSVKIDPDEGPIHTEVTINCYGFTASQDVRVKFRDIVIGTGKANTVGSLAIIYTIQPTPSGLYTFEIEAKEGTEWVSWVSKYFKVTATQCFIATAAYGTPMAQEIQVLREFRDKYLITNPLGQALVDFYYEISPPIAEFISEHPNLKPMVRAGLTPVVVMSTLAVNTSLAQKVVIIGLLALVSLVVIIWVIRRRGRDSKYI